MTKDELISKQQLEIEEYKIQSESKAQLKKQLIARFVSIGQPLNDNVLQFNKEQQKWCLRVLELIEQL